MTRGSATIAAACMMLLAAPVVTACTGSGPVPGQAAGPSAQATQSRFHLTWPPATWTAAALTGPAGARTGKTYADAVACPSWGQCMLVGQYVNGGGQVSLLVDTASKGGWEQQTSAPPTVGSASKFPNFAAVGLACPMPGDCIIAADSDLTSNPNIKDLRDAGLIYTLSQGAWTTIRLPLPGTGKGESMDIEDLSCPGASDCVAVGRIYSVNGPNNTGALAMIATLHGGTWTVAKAPLPGNAMKGWAANAYLYGVACTAPGSCVAVGGYQQAGLGGRALIETLADGAWRPATAPIPADTNTAGLNDVACPAAGSCVAVGDYNTDTDTPSTQGLIDTLENGTWRAISAPGPADSPDRFGGYLYGVACPATGSCAAVGEYYTEANEDTNQSLIGTLAGGTWTALTGPLPNDAATTGQGALLFSVDCPHTGACLAAGYYLSGAKTEEPLVESAAVSPSASAVAQSCAGNTRIVPGHCTPEQAVDGFFHGELAGDWAQACSYVVPSGQAVCQQDASAAASSPNSAPFTGKVTIGVEVIFGSRALVGSAGSLCGSSGACISTNSDSGGMPDSGAAAFETVYNESMSNADGDYASFSPLPCLKENGLWYVNITGPPRGGDLSWPR
jgi:hypothetical protein